MNRVSVIMPAYKKRFLNDAISSVLAQTYKDFEFIIVNDKSPEDLDSVVNSYEDSRIKYYVNEENIGGKDPVANWNKCLSYATGEFVCLLCDDDRYEPEFIEKMLQMADRYPTVDLFHARVKVVDAYNNLIGNYNTVAEYLSAEDIVFHLVSGFMQMTVSEWFIRRNRMIEVGGYFAAPMALFADNLSIVQFGLKGGMVSTSEQLVVFRHSGENISDQYNKNAYAWLEAIDVYEKEMRRIVSNNNIEQKDVFNKMIAAQVIADKSKIVYELTFSQLLKAIIHKNKFELPLWLCILGIYMYPVNKLRRMRKK